MNEEVTQVAQDVFRTSQEAQRIREEGERRRDDVFRLRLELEEIQTDHARALKQQEKLRESLITVRGQIERMERRKAQLVEASGQQPPDYDN